jgi:hypothetical protein
MDSAAWIGIGLTVLAGGFRLLSTERNLRELKQAHAELERQFAQVQAEKAEAQRQLDDCRRLSGRGITSGWVPTP